MPAVLAISAGRRVNCPYDDDHVEKLDNSSNEYTVNVVGDLDDAFAKMLTAFENADHIGAPGRTNHQ